MLFSRIFVILVLAIRCYAVIAYHIEASMQNNPINNGFLLLIFISGYLRNVSFIMMVSHRLYQDLRDTASRDFLTTVYNRRATQQLLDKEFHHFQRYHNHCSLILLDIDYFKAVNDSYGHETGDKILHSVTAVLTAQLRKTDILGRWGGEEFLVVLPSTTIEQAIEVAEKLRHELAKEKMLGISCTIS
ncbi:MAG: GGDEF domain-containing protein [Methylococcales bacterium]|nr:GGDEF domain-containing protein [Methylococcales bacterium]